MNNKVIWFLPAS